MSGTPLVSIVSDAAAAVRAHRSRLIRSMGNQASDQASLRAELFSIDINTPRTRRQLAPAGAAAAAARDCSCCCRLLRLLSERTNDVRMARFAASPEASPISSVRPPAALLRSPSSVHGRRSRVGAVHIVIVSSWISSWIAAAGAISLARYDAAFMIN